MWPFSISWADPSYLKQLKNHAADIRDEEDEACAKIADDVAREAGNPVWETACRFTAYLIRARIAARAKG